MVKIKINFLDTNKKIIESEEIRCCSNLQEVYCKVGEKIDWYCSKANNHLIPENYCWVDFQIINTEINTVIRHITSEVIR